MVITTERVKPKLAYEDCARLPDDERCELIDCELIPMPSPKEIRRKIPLTPGARRLWFALERQLAATRATPC